jgi:hypothetical protein
MLILSKCRPLLLVTVVSMISVFGQDATRFLGTWKGEHAGKPYMLISIAAGTPLKISVTTASIHVDETGEISKVEGPVEHEETVLESKLVGGRLRFKTRQEDGSVIDYEMRLEGESTAFLTLLDEPPFVKPFRLQRQ